MISEVYSFDCHGKVTKQSSDLAKNNYLLRAENIRYGVPDRRRKILDIPGLMLRQGKIVFALGANGAGKSTLLHFLGGRLYVPEARLFVKGKLLPPLTEKLLPGYRGIELIRQEPDLNPHFRVEEELDRHLRVFDPGTSERKKQLYVRKFRLRNLLSQKTGSISGGERRRLALACALAGSPELILLDEPFSDLDAEGKNLLSQLILEMASEGIAFLIVSHHGSDSHWLADEIWTLDGGRLIERLTNGPQGFFPTRTKTASLLGMRNIFPSDHFPELAGKNCRRVAFPESKIQRFVPGMLALGEAICIRKRLESGIEKCLWRLSFGLLFSNGSEPELWKEGEMVLLGVSLKDIFFLR